MDFSMAFSKFHEFIPKSYLYLRNGYSFSTFKKDLVAGLTVGIIALPLAMAFAIASNVGPERGLYTAVIAGFLISLFGGSRIQIGGPTGAFVVIIYGIMQRTGYEGLCMSMVNCSYYSAAPGNFPHWLLDQICSQSFGDRFHNRDCRNHLLNTNQRFFRLAYGDTPRRFY